MNYLLFAPTRFANAGNGHLKREPAVAFTCSIVWDTTTSTSATGQNWTDKPPPHPQVQPNMTSSSSNKLWLSRKRVIHTYTSVCMYLICSIVLRVWIKMMMMMMMNPYNTVYEIQSSRITLIKVAKLTWCLYCATIPITELGYSKDYFTFLAMIRSERPHILLTIDMVTFVAPSDQNSSTQLKFPNQFHGTLEGAVLFGSDMFTVSNK